MKNTKITVTGMHCKSCETLLTDVLSEIDGVSSAKVSLKDGTAEVTHSDDVSAAQLRGAIEAEGYKTK